MKIDYRVYKRAAKRINLTERDIGVKFSCTAINEETGHSGLNYSDDPYIFSFMKTMRNMASGVWSFDGSFETRQLQRTLALLLMAEYVRTDL